MTNWRSVVVPKSATLAEAIKCIDASALQVALVLEADGVPAGVLTDGDVRRALLRGLGMNGSVLEAMNPNPTTASIGTPRDKLLAQMRRLSLRHIPLVDGAGVVVGLVTLSELTGITRQDNWVVLMAGGLGSRLRPLTDDCPKPMLHVGNKPLLQTIIEKFIADGFYKFFISVNHKAEVIKSYFGDGSEWNVEIAYLHENERQGTAGALSLLPSRPTMPFIVMNGDLLTNINFQQLLEFHENQTVVATMGVREHEIQVPYGVVTTDGSNIVSIDEKHVQQFFINAGIYALSPDVLDYVPSNSYFDMPTLFSAIIRTGTATTVFPIREYWLDIGHMADYHRANGEYLEVFN